MTFELTQQSRKGNFGSAGTHVVTLGPPQGPRYRPTVGSYAVTVFYERGIPVVMRRYVRPYHQRGTDSFLAAMLSATHVAGSGAVPYVIEHVTYGKEHVTYMTEHVTYNRTCKLHD